MTFLAFFSVLAAVVNGQADPAMANPWAMLGEYTGKPEDGLKYSQILQKLTTNCALDKAAKEASPAFVYCNVHNCVIKGFRTENVFELFYSKAKPELCDAMQDDLAKAGDECVMDCQISEDRAMKSGANRDSVVTHIFVLISLVI